MIKRIIGAILMGIFGIIFSVLALPCIVIWITIYMIGVCIMVGYKGNIFGENESEENMSNKYKNV